MVTHNASLKKWLLDCDYACLLIEIAKAHDMGIAPVAVDTTHDTLIVAEKEDGETGYEVDKDEEGPFLVPPRYVVALDVVHSCCCWPAGLAVE